jgi:hypothetical protein
VAGLTNWDLGACCCGPGFYLCGTCDIPQTDLTFTWVNSISGAGSATMVYNAFLIQWKTACITDQLFFNALLDCATGSPRLTVTSYANASCTITPDGCDTISGSPHRIDQTGLTCGSSFLLTATCGANCTTFAVNGYTDFSVHA